jgi:heterotetrameric sarcosine oxidase alpha subunit
LNVRAGDRTSLLARARAATPAMVEAPTRLTNGGAIDRSSPASFSFDGRPYSGFVGDTLASALLANGVRLVGRSFKYHRPRGIYSSGTEEPNALVTLDRGALTEPNTRATDIELYEGLAARSQNRWPSLAFDLMSVNQLLAPLIPAGFYYKTFMWPGTFWMFYERFIRRAAGMGVASRRGDPSRYERNHVFCDVLVVGGGPAGIGAALAAGRAGARVILVEREPILGGALWRDEDVIDGASADVWLLQSRTELSAMPNVRVMLRTTAFGYYDHNFLGVIERVTDHLASLQSTQPRQRLHSIRAKHVVLATGAIERPLVFENNDRPGVMLAGSVRTYVKRFAVIPGHRAVVFTNNDDAYRTALILHRAGVSVRAIIDSRPAAGGPLPCEARRLGIECLTGHAVLRAHGKLGVDGIEVVRLNTSDGPTVGKSRRLDCDLLAISGGWNPTVHLHSQSGGKPVFDPILSAFVPGPSKQAESSAGSSAGVNTLSTCLKNGFAVGTAAAIATGFKAASSPVPIASGPESTATTPLWVVPGAERHAFVDIQDDVTTADVALAHREGYVSVEHLKRYTTLGMGTDQGKTSNVNGLAIMAALQGRSIAEIGTTTFRPPYIPVAIGAFAGRETGSHYQPVRRTPMHDWHEAHGAQMVEAGLWMRPRCYPQAHENLRQAYTREAAHVRNAVGLIDVSTLGKIDIQGPDAIELIERVYANNWRSLARGHVRYGLMLREDGIVFDDGTTARLGEHHYFMTTTTANAAKVLAHLEFLLQVVWPELRAHVTSLTEQWATMTLAGPRSRSVLSRVIEGGAAAAANEVLPHLGAVRVRVAGMPCRVFRMTYSGELAYEITAPADQALRVWEATLEAGRADDIQPYGTEAMGALRIEKGHVAGPELDGRTTADDLGLGALQSTKKDFIGRRLSQRPELRNQERPQLVGLIPLDPTERLRAGGQIVETARPAGITPMVGHVSSMTYSPVFGHEIALGFVNGGRVRVGQVVYAAFPLKNEVTTVRIVDSVFYDKEGRRFRG